MAKAQKLARNRSYPRNKKERNSQQATQRHYQQQRKETICDARPGLTLDSPCLEQQQPERGVFCKNTRPWLAVLWKRRWIEAGIWLSRAFKLRRKRFCRTPSSLEFDYELRRCDTLTRPAFDSPFQVLNKAWNDVPSISGCKQVFDKAEKNSNRNIDEHKANLPNSWRLGRPNDGADWSHL